MKAGPEPVPGAPATLSRALLLPLQPTGLVLIGLYAVLVRFVQSMTMSEPLQVVIVVGLSAPLWYALAAALSLYAQKLLKHTAQGLTDERIDDATDLNPFQRPLAFKLAVVFGLVMIVLLVNGREFDSLWLLIPIFVFPLLWLGVSLEEALFAAFHPVRAWRIVVGLGPLLPAAVPPRRAVGLPRRPQRQPQLPLAPPPTPRPPSTPVPCGRPRRAARPPRSSAGSSPSTAHARNRTGRCDRAPCRGRSRSSSAAYRPSDGAGRR